MNSICEKISSLKDSNNIAQFLKIEKGITIPENSNLRVNYKQQRDIEKLEFKIYWPQREEFKIL
ncbi:MAG: hypothetical protein LKE46_16090 [Clostridium sp.]|uniref:hypothetical protein n=1 Tax=Clostridium sp. TaxID=1506 RepID=UPI0025BA7E7D|nr:hypothetical protein [Clostridium sp.]MCH3965736.1 hypothetical protein [Clostridium sp.]